MQASPGSAEGNSVVDRKQITSDDGPAPAKRGLFGFLSNNNEVASVGENPVEGAAAKVEEGVESVPGPQSLFGGLFKADTEGRFGSPKEAEVTTHSFPYLDQH